MYETSSSKDAAAVPLVESQAVGTRKGLTSLVSLMRPSWMRKGREFSTAKSSFSPKRCCRCASQASSSWRCVSGTPAHTGLIKVASHRLISRVVLSVEVLGSQKLGQSYSQ